MNFTTFDKALVAGLPVVLQVLQALGALPLGPVGFWINLGVTVLTPVLVYLKSNKPAVAK